MQSALCHVLPNDSTVLALSARLEKMDITDNRQGAENEIWGPLICGGKMLRVRL